MIIAGLTGGIGYGKTTFASFLAASSKHPIHFETWELVAEVANALRSDNGFVHPQASDIQAINEWLYALPDITEQHVHASIEFGDIRVTEELLREHPAHYNKLFEYLTMMADKPELQDVEVAEDTKITFRPLLQWLGGYLVIKVGPGVWYDEIVRRVAHASRGNYDLATVGGVRFPGDAERLRNAGGAIIQINRPSLLAQDSTDITERERSSIVPDCIVHNSGSIEELKQLAKTVYKDLQMRQLQEQYISVKA